MPEVRLGSESQRQRYEEEQLVIEISGISNKYKPIILLNQSARILSISSLNVPS